LLVSDGNENRGNVLEQALAAKNLGVQVDVVPIEYHYDREVLVEKVSIPPDVRKARRSTSTWSSAPASRRAARFRSSKRPTITAPPRRATSNRSRRIKARRERLDAQQLITKPNFYTFTAEFNPEKGSGDRRAINNVARDSPHARGTAQVLLIEGKRASTRNS